MTIQMFDPVADVEAVERKAMNALETLKGKRIGYIFNQHISALDFWKSLETEVTSHLSPASVHAIYKPNTWAQAPKVDTDRMVAETDYTLVGVGA